MLNQVILIGRLVKKPELRVSEGGVNYIKATLANLRTRTENMIPSF